MQDLDRLIRSLDAEQSTFLADALLRAEAAMIYTENVGGCTGQCLDSIPFTDVRAAAFGHTRHIHDRALKLAQLPGGIDTEAAVQGLPELTLGAMISSGGLVMFTITAPGVPCPIAKMTVSEEPWTIAYIDVEASWRRQGLATALYRHAVDRLGPVAHSSHRTSLGQLWAPTVGGELPPLGGRGR